MQVNHFLENAVKKYPDKDAVWYKDQWMTYSEIDLLSNKIGNYLKDNGICRGDRVALLYENSFNYIAAYFGIIKVGGVSVALNTGIKADSLNYLLNDSEAKAIITNKKYCLHLIPALKKAPYLREVIIDQEDISSYRKIGHCNPVQLKSIFDHGKGHHPGVRCIDVDLEAIVYTSGSTGKPKGVIHSHLNIVSNMHSIMEYLKLTEHDRIMVILPFYYIYGKSLLLTHFLCGGSIVIDNRFAFPIKVLETMEKTKATGFAGVPSTFMILLNRTSLTKYSFPSLRYVTQAGGAMAPSVQEKVVKTFKSAMVYIMYGATEAAPRLSYLEPEDLPRKLGSIGKAVPNVDLFIADDKGNELHQGKTGEIVARGSNIMQGYWKDPDGTAEVLKNGLYYTGDLGRIDDEGYLFIEGRLKEIIKVKGFRVSAKEIEETILELSWVHEVAVVGVEDPILGEAIKAYIVPRQKEMANAQSVKRFIARKLADYKQPKYIEFPDKLLKNESGKILKTKLQ